MKKTVSKIVLGMAVTAAIGAGAAAVNGFIVSSVLASGGVQDTPVITQDLAAPGTNTESGRGAVISVDDNGKETIVSDEALPEDQKPKTREELARLQKDLEGGEASETGTPVFVAGTPSEKDLTETEAIKTAKEAITKEYALTKETLSRFSIDTAFNVADLNAPIWSITFYPTDQNDFSEIGTYNITVDSQSGKIIKILSAADGVG